jgi:hypothetical protein
VRCAIAAAAALALACGEKTTNVLDAQASDAHVADVFTPDAAAIDAGEREDAAVLDAEDPIDAASSPDAGPLVLAKAYTEHLGKLTDTSINPLRPLGMIGTDLGVSFEHDGRLVFLFGDSWLTGPDLSRWDDDSAAWTELAREGDALPQLHWFEEGGAFRTLSVPNVNLKGMNVPVEGIVAGATTYVFFSTGFSAATGRHTHSVLAHATGDGFSAFAVDHVVESDKLINVSIVEDGADLWIFGSGHYRRSAVYLAKVAKAELADRDRWTYWQGGAFGSGEASAVPIVDAACVGELSVRKHPSRALYLMTYNCDAPRGIHLRYATAPAGPWSEPIVVFDPAPDQDRGYQHFIHAKEDVVGFDDGLSEPGREGEWGGEYGPYLVPQWFTSESGVHSIVYVLSSWNPYQVHLMKTVLTEPGATVAPPARGADLPRATLINGDFANGTAGWQSSGDAFGVFVGDDGRPRLTTYTQDEGDAAVGRLWQDFAVDASTSELRFAVHGGTAAVELWVGDDIVRSTRGRNQNTPDLQVRWQLSSLRGKTVRLMIRDEQTGPWGFIGTTGFELD